MHKNLGSTLCKLMDDYREKTQVKKEKLNMELEQQAKQMEIQKKMFFINRYCHYICKAFTDALNSVNSSMNYYTGTAYPDDLEVKYNPVADNYSVSIIVSYDTELIRTDYQDILRRGLNRHIANAHKSAIIDLENAIRKIRFQWQQQQLEFQYSGIFNGKTESDFYLEYADFFNSLLDKMFKIKVTEVELCWDEIRLTFNISYDAIGLEPDNLFANVNSGRF